MRPVQGRTWTAARVSAYLAAFACVAALTGGEGGLIPLQGFGADAVAILWPALLTVLAAVAIVTRTQAPRVLTVCLAVVFVSALIIVSDSGLSEIGVRSIAYSGLAIVVLLVAPVEIMEACHSALRFYAALSVLGLLVGVGTRVFSGTAARGDLLGSIGPFRLEAYTASPNLAGSAFAALVVLDLIALRYRRASMRSRRHVLIQLVSLATGGVLLLWTGSQTAIVAAVVGAAALVTGLRTFAAIATFLVLLVPAAFGVALAIGAIDIPAFPADFATGRGAIWNQAALLMSQNPWLGLPAAWSLPSEESNALTAFGGGHAHNALLQLWLLGGLVLTTAVVVGLLGALRSVIRVPQRAAAWSALCILGAAEVPILWLPGSLNGLILMGLASSIVVGGTNAEQVESDIRGITRGSREPALLVGHL